VLPSFCFGPISGTENGGLKYYLKSGSIKRAEEPAAFSYVQPGFQERLS
jgi:hypothetical protein